MMIIEMIADQIKVDMFVGICDFEYLNPQPVVVNVRAYGDVVVYPKSISECLDYSKVCSFVKGWEKKPHVELVETLLMEVIAFCFAQDQRIFKVEVEILKPQVIAYASQVGIKCSMNRPEFLQIKEVN